jgi:hypothetical protein
MIGAVQSHVMPERPTSRPDPEDAGAVPSTTVRHRLRRLRRGGWPLVGVLAGAVVMGALALLVVLAVRPFASADENAHADYALSLATEGRLPTLFDRVTPLLPFMHDGLQHVANHPPLFYLLAGQPLAWGVHSGHPFAGYVAAKVLSAVLAGVGTALLTSLLAHELFRGRRPAVTIGAGALVATYSFFVLVCGALHNDALAVFFSAAMTVCSAFVLLRGPSLVRLGLLAVVCLAGVATRADNATLLVMGGAAALLAFLIHTPAGQRWRLGLAKGLGAGLAIGLVSLGGIGWFFLRSIHLYGNANGYGVLNEAAARKPRGETFWLLHHPSWLPFQFGITDIVPGLSARELLGMVPVGLVLIGALVGITRLVRRNRRAAGGAARTEEQRIRRAALWSFAGLSLANGVASFVMIMHHVDLGGGLHVRYLFPLLPVVAVAAAAALSELPLRRFGVPLMVAVVVETVLTVDAISHSAYFWVSRQATGPVLPGLRDGIARLGVPHPTLVLAALLATVVVGLGVVAVSVVRVSDRSRVAGLPVPVDRAGQAAAPVPVR